MLSPQGEAGREEGDRCNRVDFFECFFFRTENPYLGHKEKEIRPLIFLSRA